MVANERLYIYVKDYYQMNYIFHKSHIHIITIIGCLLRKFTYNCYDFI